MKKIILTLIICLSMVGSATQAHAEPKREILMAVSATFFSTATIFLIIKGLQKQPKAIETNAPAKPFDAQTTHTFFKESFTLEPDASTD